VAKRRPPRPAIREITGRVVKVCATGFWYHDGPRLLSVPERNSAGRSTLLKNRGLSFSELTNMQAILISAAIGYLLGSIPFGYILVRTFRGADIRTTGSGNIGATNVARTSPALGLVTLLLDAGKGLAAVGLVSALFPGSRELLFVAGFAALCGHIFPVWLRFRGGKGVATALGSFLMLTPKAMLMTLAIFIVVAVSFRYVALGSIIAAISFPLLALFLGDAHGIEFALAAATSLLIIFKHHQNIRRMLSGTEPKFQFNRR
jgi:glycerol-3-phosphate acyltransferase PlsY